MAEWKALDMLFSEELTPAQIKVPFRAQTLEGEEVLVTGVLERTAAIQPIADEPGDNSHRRLVLRHLVRVDPETVVFHDLGGVSRFHRDRKAARLSARRGHFANLGESIDEEKADRKRRNSEARAKADQGKKSA